jgi:hypothetical protein
MQPVAIQIHMSSTYKEPGPGGGEDLKWLEIVRQQVGSLQYGVVEIVVHDSRVTQIEKTERIRLDKPAGEIRPERKQ